MNASVRAKPTTPKINGPLRGGKHTECEGGFREPFLVRWPGQVPAGTVGEQVIGIVDVLGTIAGVLKVPLRKGHAEDSFDVSRAFTERHPGALVRDHIIVQSADAVYGIRMYDLKRVERVGAPTFQHRNAQKGKQAAKKAKSLPNHDELINLKTDPAEASDVSAQHTADVDRMKTTLTELRDRGSSRAGAQ